MVYNSLVAFVILKIGNWGFYKQDPDTFISLFRNLSVIIKNQTNSTAMVWSPVSVSVV